MLLSSRRQSPEPGDVEVRCVDNSGYHKTIFLPDGERDDEFAEDDLTRMAGAGDCLGGVVPPTFRGSWAVDLRVGRACRVLRLGHGPVSD